MRSSYLYCTKAYVCEARGKAHVTPLHRYIQRAGWPAAGRSKTDHFASLSLAGSLAVALFRPPPLPSLCSLWLQDPAVNSFTTPQEIKALAYRTLRAALFRKMNHHRRLSLYTCYRGSLCIYSSSSIRV